MFNAEVNNEKIYYEVTKIFANDVLCRIIQEFKCIVRESAWNSFHFVLIILAPNEITARHCKALIRSMYVSFWVPNISNRITLHTSAKSLKPGGVVYSTTDHTTDHIVLHFRWRKEEIIILLFQQSQKQLNTVYCFNFDFIPVRNTNRIELLLNNLVVSMVVEQNVVRV